MVKIEILKSEKMEFGKDVLYKNLCSVNGSDFTKTDDTVYCYTKQPLVPKAFYDCKLKCSNDLKSIKLEVGNQIK